MNIHEYQAKKLLKKFGAPVPNGVHGSTTEEILNKTKLLNTEKYVLKAQIHSGGRGKAGGIKITNTLEELKQAADQILGKTLVTNQTGPKGKKVKKLYVEESSNIDKEFYLSCLVDRAKSKIAFISCLEGGMDIEEIAIKKPEKIITTRVDVEKEISDTDCERIIEVFKLEYDAKDQATDLIKSIYKIFIEKDASLIEINPLVLTKENNILCLDAKINFDDNAIFRHPDISELRDLKEEDPIEIEAKKKELSYIKLDGNIGCMVNGAGLAMATMDIIKMAGGNPANFLDVGGTADAKRVEQAFRIILKDQEVKAILVNIFGGIVRCDRVAQGIVDAYNNIGKINVPLIIRLEGTNAIEAKKLIDASGLKVESVILLQEAADKVTEVLS